jgi:hypothetical protein
MEKIINRIKTKPGYKIIAFLLILFLPFYLLAQLNNQELNKIKNNPDIIVECQIKNKGWVVIDKNKIIDIDDDGTFIFENGYAKNCIVEGK